MAEVILTQKQHRVRCTDEKFLEAVFSSRTYADIAQKTGQKIGSTMTRYGKTKKLLAKKGIDIPEMQRKKSHRKVDKEAEMIAIVKRLKEHHNDN